MVCPYWEVLLIPKVAPLDLICEKNDVIITRQTELRLTYFIHTYISSVLNIYHGMVWKKKLLQPATDNKFPMNTCQKIFLSFCVPIFLDGGTLTWIVESSFTLSSTILHFLAYILCSKSKLINLSVLYFVKARPAIKFVMVHAHAVLFFL